MCAVKCIVHTLNRQLDKETETLKINYMQYIVVVQSVHWPGKNVLILYFNLLTKSVNKRKCFNVRQEQLSDHEAR